MLKFDLIVIWNMPQKYEIHLEFLPDITNHSRSNYVIVMDMGNVHHNISCLNLEDNFWRSSSSWSTLRSWCRCWQLHSVLNIWLKLRIFFHRIQLYLVFVGISFIICLFLFMIFFYKKTFDSNYSAATTIFLFPKKI